MNPYLFTLTFLMMMSLLTSSEVVRFQQSAFEHRNYLESQHYLAAAEELRELSHLATLKNEQKDDDEEKPDPPPKPINVKKSRPYRVKALGVDAARPPNNSRLNLYALIHKTPNKDLPEEFSLYEVTARVIRSLFREESFYSAGLEYRLLDKLSTLKAETAEFTTPDQFSTLNLEDPELQNALFMMFKGTKNAPSLLHFITFDAIDSTHSPSRKINFMFVDPIVLRAIFPERDTANKLLEKREEIWSTITYQEEHRLDLPKESLKGRKKWNAEIKVILEDALSSAGYDAHKYLSQVFDYSLNNPGTIIFLENPLTHTLTREIYTPPVQK